MSNSTPEQAVVKISNLKGFTTVLQAIKPSSARQVCTMILGSEGLRVNWEDDSKCLQSSLFLGPQLFAQYSCPWVRKAFGLQFGMLLDTISVFHSSLSSSDLVMKFPGTNGDLICEMMEESTEQTTICTYSQIDSREVSQSRDLADYWKDPSSFFLISGSLLKEAIEDLEWAAGNGSMALHIQRDPPSISMSASSASGSLEIKLPVAHLQGFQCAEPSIQQQYRYKSLRATVANLPQPRDAAAQTASKVTIDSQGLIKVTHMMSLQGGPRTFGGTYQGIAAFAESQRASTANAGIVQFLCAPEELLTDEV